MLSKTFLLLLLQNITLCLSVSNKRQPAFRMKYTTCKILKSSLRNGLVVMAASCKSAGCGSNPESRSNTCIFYPCVTLALFCTFWQFLVLWQFLALWKFVAFCHFVTLILCDTLALLGTLAIWHFVALWCTRALWCTLAL